MGGELGGHIQALSLGEPPQPVRTRRQREFLDKFPVDTKAEDYLDKVPWAIASDVMERFRPNWPEGGEFSAKLCAELTHRCHHIGLSEFKCGMGHQRRS